MGGGTIRPAGHASSAPLSRWVAILAAAGAVSVLVAGGCLGTVYCVVSRGSSAEPDRVAELAGQIADFELPAGYQPLLCLRLVGSKVAAFGRPGRAGPLLVLGACPLRRSASAPELAKRVRGIAGRRSAGKRRGHGPSNPTTRTVILRGQRCSLAIERALGDDGLTWVQATAAFVAKDGTPAILALYMTERYWQRRGPDELNTILRSMR